LERLVEAFLRLQDCEPDEQPKSGANYRRLLQDAAARLPSGHSLDELQTAIAARARQMKLARKRYTTLPPKA
jgi:hypothetical protein